jgi:UPF0755 protein
VKLKNYLVQIFKSITGFIGKYVKAHHLMLTLLALGLVILIAFTAYNIFAPLNTNEIIIRIKQGGSTKSIAQELKANHIIRSAFWFDVLARLSRSDRHLKAGRYVFGGNVSIMQTIIKIREGRSTMMHLTIPEGFSLFRTIKQLETSGVGSYDSLLAVASDPKVIKNLTGHNWKSLEGFLYPETYTFDIDLKPEQIFAIMTEQFFIRLKGAGIVISDEKQFYKDLIVASIVEQEAVMEDEKPLIAAVYLNRMKKGMKLESCPTVDYTLERQGIRRKRLTYDDLQIESEYNTYRISGLPPTPICNPSISSLQAVYQPQTTEYLYFFADFEGRNVFSKTYAEHLRKQKLIFPK